MTTSHKPRLRTRHKESRQAEHRLKSLIPSTLAMLRHPASTAGFGAPAGYTRICTCGHQSRDRERFADHITSRTIKDTIMHDPFALLDDANLPFRHRLTDTADRGRILICSCGRDFPTLTRMQEHIRYVNQGTRHE